MSRLWQTAVVAAERLWHQLRTSAAIRLGNATERLPSESHPSGRAATGLHRLPLSLAALFFLTGCAGYQLGPVNGVAAREKSVQVSPFINQTLQPRLTDAVTMQMRKELQRDGTYQLSSRNDADILVSGTLTRYERAEVTLSSSDILTVRDFRLILTAHVKVRDRATGKEILDQQVTGHTLIRVGSDLPSTERQALPLLAQDLARNVTSLLVEGKW